MGEVIPLGELKKTPLHALHVELGARFAEFAGYDMPIQYRDGIMAEHEWTRTHCGLFDVSHMGPCFLVLNETEGFGEAGHVFLSRLVERVVPSDIAALAPGKIQLSVLLSDEGGILDDLMIARPGWPSRQSLLYIVVNAGTKEQDFEMLRVAAGRYAELRRADMRALVALQGPEAEAVLSAIAPGVEALSFMQMTRVVTPQFGELVIARCGYTGEDGFEVLVFAEHADAFARHCLADPRVKPIGLGARDSLRLEAGLCLYGHDIDARVSPVGAGLSWMVSKTRRERRDFPGAVRILHELSVGAPTRRVGIKPLGRQPAREGVEVQSADGEPIGVLTSGGFGPTVNGPVAMGWVQASHAAPGTPVKLLVRGKQLDAEITKLPFVPTRYKR